MKWNYWSLAAKGLQNQDPIIIRLVQDIYVFTGFSYEHVAWNHAKIVQHVLQENAGTVHYELIRRQPPLVRAN